MLDHLIRHEWPRLERFFKSKLPPSDVTDVAQSTCLAFVEQFDATREGAKAYLWGIARKQVLRHWEKFHGRRAEPFDSTQHSLLDIGPSLSSVIDRRNRVQEALQAIPADHQIAIELRHVEGLKLEEVAVALDVSLATAKRYIDAAERKLREMLGDGQDVVAAMKSLS